MSKESSVSVTQEEGTCSSKSDVLEPYQMDYNDGVDAMEAGLLQEAEEKFLSSINKEPSVAASWIGLGKVQAMQEKIEKAAESFQWAFLLEPTNPKPQYNLALLYLQMGDAQTALSFATEARRLDSSNTLFHTISIKIFLHQNKWEDAIFAYQSLAAESSKHADEFAHLVVVAYMQTGQYKEAETIADRALAHLRTSDDFDLKTRTLMSCEVWNNLAIIYKHLDRLQEALSCYDLIEPAFESRPEFWINRGNCCRFAKLFPNAVSHLCIALRMVPNHPIALVNLALTYKEMGPECTEKFEQTRERLEAIDSDVARRLSESLNL